MKTKTGDTLAAAFRKFDRFSGARGRRMDSAAALRQVLDLPESQWFATRAPVDAFRIDAPFLNHLDADRDGHLRPTEVKSAIRWLFRVFERFDDEAAGQRSLELSRIRQDDEDGQHILAAAENVLQLRGKSGSARVDLSDVRQVRKQMESDGWGQPECIAESADCSASCRQLIRDILSCAGEPGAGEHGERSLSEADFREFQRQIQQLADWEETAPAEYPPFGEEIETQYQLYTELRSRIESFFALCQLAKVNPQIKAMMANAEAPGEAPNWRNWETVESLARRSPVATVNSDGVLKFNGPLNPLDARKLKAFQKRIFAPMFGESSNTLKREQWEAVKQGFSRYDSWARRAPKTAASGVAAPRRRAYLAPDSAAVELDRLFREARENAAQFEKVMLLEKAILFQAHLLAFANNFASCPDLHSLAKRALFEMGTLIFAGRELNFCIRVADREKHIQRCRGENVFVVYAEIHSADGTVECEAAAPVTDGESGQLRAGQWGLFLDTQGREFSAAITQVIECPVNLREGMAASFKRLGKFAAGLPEVASPEAQAKASDGRMRNALAGGGLVLAALGLAGAFILRTLADAELLRLLAVGVGLAAAVLIPPAAATAIRLRNRDLRCLLEGAGWGVNLKMRLTPGLARAFTRRRE